MNQQQRPSVIVIGGGLAGIAAAVRLAQAGRGVTLVETRKRLGGRATSFVDPGSGQVLDNCQHVLMRCCTHLIDLYRRLGVEHHIRWHRRFHFCDRQGTMDVLEGDDLPAPLHLARSLLAFGGLNIFQKMAIARAVTAMIWIGPAGRSTWHTRSFADWLARHRQPAAVVEKFWAPIVVSALNETPDRMAADYALQVFQEGFLANATAYEMGLSTVPLTQLYDAAEGVIAAAGGTLMLATSAEALMEEGGRIVALKLADGSTLRAEAFVSALPFDRLDKLCTEAMRRRDERLGQLNGFEVSPILGIHLYFDRRVMDLPHLALTQSPLHWIFNKGLDLDGQGQYLHGVISAAHDLVDQPAGAILDMVVKEVHQALPAARAAALRHGRVIKEKRATFSIAPGVDRLRAEASGTIGNLYLAGDWCRSGWPATMEGAVRSGYLAAAAMLRDGGEAGHTRVADMPLSPLLRWRW